MDNAPSVSPSCPQCGRPIPVGFGAVSCPACLLLGVGTVACLDADMDPTVAVAIGGSSQSAAVQAAPGVIGPYRLLEPLGEGGFGVVYRALQQEPIRREVALKLIKPGMGSREVLARFEAERRAVALMEHPNIAAVLDAGTAENGQPYFVMELVRGQPITTYCDARRLTIRQRLELFIPVCQAVQHAHQKAVLHRDLKPSNILVAEVDGQPLVKVIDFGVAKALGQDGEESWQSTLARTLDGMVVGTPQYMSPEQAGAAPDLDTRSDVYTLGVILYELLCGETPLRRESLRQAAVDEMLRRIREEEVVRPSSKLTPVSEAVRARAETRQVAPEKMSRELKGDLDWITLRALEKDRERRYGSTEALAADIHRHLACEPVEAGPPSAWYQFGKFARRNRLALASASSIAVLLVAGVAVSTWQAVRAMRAEKQAEASARHAREANNENLAMLREASAADYQTAVQRSEKDGKRSEGVVYLARALKWQPDNTLAAARLYGELVERISSETRANLRGNLRHQGDVKSAQFSPDGSRIVTASYDGTAQMWDAATGKALGEPLRHQGGVNSAQFSPDGSRIVTASHDNTAQVWDAATGKALGEPLRHQREVHSAQFSPDGSRIVTASWDKTAQVWDAATGKALGEPLRHHGRVHSAQFSPDGSRIVSTSHGDDTAQVWDAATGKVLGEPLRHQGAVNSAQFSPDGSRIVTASKDKTAQVWDAATGKALGEPMRHEEVVWSAQFSPDGSLIVTASADHTARFWSSKSSESSGKFPNWVLAYAGAVCGLDFETQGGFREIPSEERLPLLRPARLGDDVWSKLARWAATPASERKLTPNSRFTCRQIAERERDSEPLSREAIESALRYDPSVPLAHVLLAEVMEKEESAKPEGSRDTLKLQQAVHLRRYGLKLLPEHDAELWCRAAESLQRQNEVTHSRLAAEKALKIAPGLKRAMAVLEH